MLPHKSFRFCSEAYQVVQSVELEVSLRTGDHRVRIDVLQEITSQKYTTKHYVFETMPVSPLGQEEKNYNYVQTWVQYDLPWTAGDTADEVLESALSFLQERAT